MLKSIPAELTQRLFDWLGKENVVWFKHVKGLKGSVNATLKLNYSKKHMPAHNTHFREGMQIRNFLRGQPECASWTHEDFEVLWAAAVDKCIELLNKKA